MIIDISGCVELNNVSPRTQSLLTFFFIFVFYLFSTNLNLPAFLKVKGNIVVKLLCSLLPHFQQKGRFSELTCLFFGLWEYEPYIHPLLFLLQVSYQFCFFVSFLQGIAFLYLKARGN